MDWRDGGALLALLLAFAVGTYALSGCDSVREAQEPDEATDRRVGVSTGWRVSRITDGDTIELSKGRRTVTVRLIGIDTPETVHPTQPIQCFGPQASAYAKEQLTGQTVTLEYDRQQGRTDRYGRTLAYLWVGEDRQWLFNKRVLSRGYGVELTVGRGYARRNEFLAAQAAARREQRGLWGSC